MWFLVLKITLLIENRKRSATHQWILHIRSFQQALSAQPWSIQLPYKACKSGTLKFCNKVPPTPSLHTGSAHRISIRIKMACLSEAGNGSSTAVRSFGTSLRRLTRDVSRQQVRLAEQLCCAERYRMASK